MALVFGKMTFDVSVGVKSEDETMGILEANYKVNPERMISYKLVAMDHNGIEHVLHIHDVDSDFQLTTYMADFD